MLGVLAITALFLTFSRTALLGLAVVIALSLWFTSRRMFMQRWALVGTVLMLTITVAASPILYSYWTARRENVTIRLAQYERAFRMIAANPIMGVGLNNSPGLQREYSRAERSSVPLGDPTGFAYTNPIHEYYITLAAETGIVGLLLYMAFFVGIVRRAMRATRSGDPEVATFSAMCVVALAGLATTVSVDPLFEDALLTPVWLYAGLIVALGRITATATGDGPAPRLAVR
jgi:O-antigen ligase